MPSTGLKNKRGRPKGGVGLMVFVRPEVEAWIRREAKRTGVPATHIIELAVLRLKHARPDAGLAELREDKGTGVRVATAAVNPAVAALWGER